MMLRRLAAVLLVACAAGTAAAPASAATTANVNAQLIPATRMAGVANRIAAHLISDPDRVVTPAFALADQYVPLGTVTIDPQSPQVYATYVAVPMQITVDGRLARTVVAGFRVQQYVRTAVAAHDLVPGALLATDDLTLARVISNGRPSVDIASLVGRRVHAATSRGASLYVEETSVNELVKAGSGAILIVRDGPVSLTADVVARTGGGIGDTVTVYNAKTNKILSGTVIGQDRVELLLPGEDE